MCQVSCLLIYITINSTLAFTPKELEEEDLKKYDLTNVYHFNLPSQQSKKIPVDIMLQIEDDPKKSSVVEDSWYLDPRMIEPEMLLLDGSEADKMYLDLKERANRRRK